MRLKTMTLLSACVVMPTAGIAYMQRGESWPQLASFNLSLPSAMNGYKSDDSESKSYENADQPQLVYANGIVEGRNRDVSLRFELTGRLSTIAVAEGDQVQKGHVLARLDATVWQHQLAEAEAALASAQAEKHRVEEGATEQARARARAEVAAVAAKVSLIRNEYERTTDLIKTLRKRSVSSNVQREELDDIRDRHRTAMAEWQAAAARYRDVNAPARDHEIAAADAELALRKAQVAHARTMLGKAELVAPSDGIILRVDAEPGELTGPESQLPLVTIVDRSEIRIRAYVEELDALRIQRDQRAHVTADGLPERKFHGKVITCHPTMLEKTEFNHHPDERIDVKTREIVILLDSKEAQDLVIGLPMDVFIALEQPGDDDAGGAPIQSFDTSLAAIQTDK